MKNFLKRLWASFTSLFKRKKKTIVKPSGTTSVLDGRSSGMHPAFGAEYKRTVSRIDTEGWQASRPVTHAGTARAKTGGLNLSSRNRAADISDYPAGRRASAASDVVEDTANILLIQSMLRNDNTNTSSMTILKERTGGGEYQYVEPTRIEDEPVRECKPTPINSIPSIHDDDCSSRSSYSSGDSYSSYSSSSDSYSSSSSDSGSSWSD